MSAGGGGPNAFAGRGCRGGDQRGSREAGSFASSGAAGEIAASDPGAERWRPKLSASSAALVDQNNAWNAGTGPEHDPRAWQQTALEYSELPARSPSVFPCFAVCLCTGRQLLVPTHGGCDAERWVAAEYCVRHIPESGASTSSG